MILRATATTRVTRRGAQITLELHSKPASVGDPNLKAAHAGASTRKTRHLQPNAANAADAEGGCSGFSRLASHIRAQAVQTLQVGGKARFASHC